MPYVTQTRLLAPFLYNAKFTRKYDGYNSSNAYSDVGSGAQTTYSFRTDRLHTAEGDLEDLSTAQLRGRVSHEHRTRYDNGHPFNSTKRWFDISHKNVLIGTPSMMGQGAWTYEGPICLNRSALLTYYPEFTLPTLNQMELDGSRGIGLTVPTAPEANLAQMLGELRERLPHIPGAELRAKMLHSGANAARSGTNATSGRGYKQREAAAVAGDEYLNVQFGIKPLLSDIEKLAHSVKNASMIIKQFRRDSGKIIRRKVSLYDRTSLTERPDEPMSLVLNPFVPGFDNVTSDFFESYSGARACSDSIRQRAWFSGAYTYHLAEAHDFLSKAEMYEQLADKLLGSSIDAALFWELTPWSWLIDWHINVGSFLRNVELLSKDSLVVRYGYVMHETHAIRTWVTKQPMIDKNGRSIGHPAAFSNIMSKNRERATPYGFGRTSSEFTPQQWAILGALGMTKSTRSLKNDLGI